MAFDEKKFVGADALSELSTKVKTELDKKTDKAGALTNVSYDTTNKKLTKTTQGAHDPITTDIVTTATLKTDMGISDFDGTFSSLKSKPTTISGYGITDAKVQNSTVTIGSNSVTALTQDDVSSTYDSSGTSPVDGKAVAAALGTLDVEFVGGAGKYISAISETDGKISATAETMDSTPTSNSTKAVTSDGIYEYVNSSVATNTAYFIGTFDSVEELEEYSGIITNNDYAFVTSTDSSGNTLYNRYKYNGSTHTWSFEYALNNSSFTSAQWATIQSGLTSSDKTKLDGIQSGANKTIVDAAMSSSSTNPVQNKVINTALAGKQDTLTFDSTPTQSSTNPVTSAGIYTDQARQDTLEAQDRAALIEVENKGAKNLCPKDSETSTAPAAFTDDFSVNLPAGTYVVSMICNVQQQFSLSFYRALPHSGNNIKNLVFDAVEPGTRQIKTVTLSEDAKFCAFYYNAAGESLTDIMICTKAEWDISQAYVPYGKTNADLTAEADYAVNTGVKNIFDIQAAATEQQTTTVLNPDGGITISCNAAVWATRNITAEIPAGDYICSLFVDAVTIGGGTFAFFVNQSTDQSTWTELARQTPITSIGRIDKTITVTQKYLRISTNLNNSDTSATNSATIRLMLRPAVITDPTFQPYARTNRDLTVLTDEDRAALVEIVDGGAKNHCTLTSGSNTLPTRWINIPVSDVGVGQWVMSFGTLTSTDTDDTFCQAICFNRSDQPVSNWVNFKRGSNTNKIFTTTDDVSYVRLYPANSFAASEGDTVTFNNAMICTAAAWKISTQYQPYRPSWQEMWDAIQALQSGGNRALMMQMQPTESTEPEGQEELELTKNEKEEVKEELKTKEPEVEEDTEIKDDISSDLER